MAGFSLRIVDADFYQIPPQQQGNLDICYSKFRQNDTRTVPVIRIFGTTPNGQKTCLHVHQVFPYLYVPVSKKEATEKFAKQFATSLDFAVHMALGKAASNLKHYVYQIDVVKGTTFYGYHEEQENFLKVSLYNPNLVNQIEELLLNGAIMKRIFQPYESHIPYLLQFFIDYNLYGMNFIHLSGVKFRQPVNFTDFDANNSLKSPLRQRSNRSTPMSPIGSPLLSQTCYEIWNGDSIPEDMLLPPSLERQSTCCLEVDANCSDILNKNDIKDSLGTCPGLAALWEEERARRKQNNEPEIPTPASQERLKVGLMETERRYLEEAKRIIESRRKNREEQMASLVSEPPVLAEEPEQADCILDDFIDESQPIVNEDVIRQSFLESSLSQSLSSTVPDDRLLELLTEMAEECEPKASQVSSISNGIAEEEAEPDNETEVAENDENETLIMSQYVYDDIDAADDKQNNSDEEIIDAGFGNIEPGNPSHQANLFFNRRSRKRWQPFLDMNEEDFQDSWSASMIERIPQLDGTFDFEDDESASESQSEPPNKLPNNQTVSYSGKSIDSSDNVSCYTAASPSPESPSSCFTNAVSKSTTESFSSLKPLNITAEVSNCQSDLTSTNLETHKSQTFKSKTCHCPVFSNASNSRARNLKFRRRPIIPQLDGSSDNDFKDSRRFNKRKKPLRTYEGLSKRHVLRIRGTTERKKIDANASSQEDIDRSSNTKRSARGDGLLKMGCDDGFMSQGKAKIASTAASIGFATSSTAVNDEEGTSLPKMVKETPGPSKREPRLNFVNNPEKVEGLGEGGVVPVNAKINDTRGSKGTLKGLKKTLDIDRGSYEISKLGKSTRRAGSRKKEPIVHKIDTELPNKGNVGGVFNQSQAAVVSNNVTPSRESAKGSAIDRGKDKVSSQRLGSKRASSRKREPILNKVDTELLKRGNIMVAINQGQATTTSKNTITSVGSAEEHNIFRDEDVTQRMNTRKVGSRRKQLRFNREDTGYRKNDLTNSLGTRGKAAVYSSSFQGGIVNNSSVWEDIIEEDIIEEDVIKENEFFTYVPIGVNRKPGTCESQAEFNKAENDPRGSTPKSVSKKLGKGKRKRPSLEKLGFIELSSSEGSVKSLNAVKETACVTLNDSPSVEEEFLTKRHDREEYSVGAIVNESVGSCGSNDVKITFVADSVDEIKADEGQKYFRTCEDDKNHSSFSGDSSAESHKDQLMTIKTECPSVTGLDNSRKKRLSTSKVSRKAKRIRFEEAISPNRKVTYPLKGVNNRTNGIRLVKEDLADKVECNSCCDLMYKWRHFSPRNSLIEENSPPRPVSPNESVTSEIGDDEDIKDASSETLTEQNINIDDGINALGKMSHYPKQLHNNHQENSLQMTSLTGGTDGTTVQMDDSDCWKNHIYDSSSDSCFDNTSLISSQSTYQRSNNCGNIRNASSVINSIDANAQEDIASEHLMSEVSDVSFLSDTSATLTPPIQTRKQIDKNENIGMHSLPRNNIDKNAQENIASENVTSGVSDVSFLSDTSATLTPPPQTRQQDKQCGHIRKESLAKNCFNVNAQSDTASEPLTSEISDVSFLSDKSATFTPPIQTHQQYNYGAEEHTMLQTEQHLHTNVEKNLIDCMNDELKSFLDDINNFSSCRDTSAEMIKPIRTRWQNRSDFGEQVSSHTPQSFNDSSTDISDFLNDESLLGDINDISFCSDTSAAMITSVRTRHQNNSEPFLSDKSPSLITPFLTHHSMSVASVDEGHKASRRTNEFDANLAKDISDDNLERSKSFSSDTSATLTKSVLSRHPKVSNSESKLTTLLGMNWDEDVSGGASIRNTSSVGSYSDTSATLIKPVFTRQKMHNHSEEIALKKRSIVGNDLDEDVLDHDKERKDEISIKEASSFSCSSGTSFPLTTTVMTRQQSKQMSIRKDHRMQKTNKDRFTDADKSSFKKDPTQCRVLVERLSFKEILHQVGSQQRRILESASQKDGKSSQQQKECYKRHNDDYDEGSSYHSLTDIKNEFREEDIVYESDLESVDENKRADTPTEHIQSREISYNCSNTRDISTKLLKDNDTVSMKESRQRDLPYGLSTKNTKKPIAKSSNSRRSDIMNDITPTKTTKKSESSVSIPSSHQRTTSDRITSVNSPSFSGSAIEKDLIPISKCSGSSTEYGLISSVVAVYNKEPSSNSDIARPQLDKSSDKSSGILKKNDMVESLKLKRSKSVILLPTKKPPSAAELMKSAPLYNLGETRHKKAFCSNSADVPAQTRRIGGNVLRIQSRKVSELQKFDTRSGFQGSLESIQREAMMNTSLYRDLNDEGANAYKVSDKDFRRMLASDKTVNLTPCKRPPSQASIKKWLIDKQKQANDRKQDEQKKTEESQPKTQTTKTVDNINATGKSKFSLSFVKSCGGGKQNIPKPFSDEVQKKSPKSPLLSPTDSRRSLGPKSSTPFAVSKKPAFKLPLTPSLTEKEKRFLTPTNAKGIGSQSSQIEGPTPTNSFGFGFTQVDFQDAKNIHEVQHITMLSLELHIQTRRDLCPDPSIDPICAMFYYLTCDTDDTKETGIFILDPDYAPDVKPAAESGTMKAHQESTVTKTIPGETSTSSMSDAASSQSITTTAEGSPTKAAAAIKTANANTSTTDAPPQHRKLLPRSGISDYIQRYFNDEKTMIQEFQSFVKGRDPDIVIGYEVEMLSWGYLIERGREFDINLSPLLSRVPSADKKSSANKNVEQESFWYGHSLELKFVGRILLNVWRIMRSEVTLRVYTFENVAFHVLHERLPKYSYRTLSAWWSHRTALHRWRVVDYYVKRSRANIEMLTRTNFLCRTSELARLFGILFYSVISRGSQYRVESMMLRIAKPMGYIPVSPSVKQRAKMAAPECIPLVMEPESRFYPDPVIVLDFQSLYPSIIIAYNYCFSTCLGRVRHWNEPGNFTFSTTSLSLPLDLLERIQDDIHISPNGVGFVKSNVRKGILPRMLEDLLNTRIMVKTSMKKNKENKALHRMLDARQLGLKLIANVTYGYTSANFSGRMPSVEIADSVVRKARETLEIAIDLINSTKKWNARVVYGDTDSVFVLLKGATKERAFAVSDEIIKAVTEMNPKPVKLKFEKVYMPCVLQTKKRYIGYMYENLNQKEPTFDAKGIETVRRDSCSAVSKILERSLKTLFETRDLSLVKKYVQRQFTKIMEERISIQDLTFAKEYRGMKNYKPGACVPALAIARRCLARDKRSEPRVGERVPYVIVYGTPGLPLIQLVKRPDELFEDPSLRLNSSYYITKQIAPSLNRAFSLVGVDVITWYNELPRPQGKITFHESKGRKKKGTISQYFSSVNCPICGDLTREGLCATCRSDPQTAVSILSYRITKSERKSGTISELCYHCTGSREQTLRCISQDCPVLHKLYHVNAELSSVSGYRELLAELI